MADLLAGPMPCVALRGAARVLLERNAPRVRPKGPGGRPRIDGVRKEKAALVYVAVRDAFQDVRGGHRSLHLALEFLRREFGLAADELERLASLLAENPNVAAEAVALGGLRPHEVAPRLMKDYRRRYRFDRSRDEIREGIADRGWLPSEHDPFTWNYQFWYRVQSLRQRAAHECGQHAYCDPESVLQKVRIMRTAMNGTRMAPDDRRPPKRFRPSCRKS